MTDPIADMLTRIRNGLMVHKPEVSIPYSRVKIEIGKILQREGFVKELVTDTDSESTQRSFRVVLKYASKEPVIRGLNRISTPGRRVYKNYREIPKVLPSLGILVVSTSGGLMTNQEAKQKHLGGEIVCEVF
ncbi:MAG: 30S ribosomal protein S8 [Patescibacteria group bacterium]|nr:30S ribosomal protein S8 [Patescibacteria group bacterium]MDD5715361.1 30S ribosomal protein S8 [Patescibacteria group bacterium]